MKQGLRAIQQMKKQQRQQEIGLETSSRTLRSEKNGLEVSLSYEDHAGTPYVRINAINSLSLDYFELHVGQDFIENHEVLFYFFDSPREFMHHLAKTFDEARLSEEGELSVEIMVGDVIRKRKTIKLQLEKKRIDKEALLNREVKALREEIQQYKLTNNSEIQELKRQNAALKQSMEKFLTKFMGKINRKSIVGPKDRTVKNLSQKIKKRQQEQLLTSHPDNADKINFREYLLDGGIRVTHDRQEWDSFVSRYPLRGKVVFSIRDIKTVKRCFNVGVGTRKAFGRCDYKQEWILIYDFKGQKLTIDGESRKIPFFLNEQTAICLQFDEKVDRVSWAAGKKEFIQAELTERMRGHQLFLIFQLFDRGDEFTLLIDK